ncbi:MAG: SDR family oxidoreductase [Nanoarchaeota archaeon]|nr:SDR family oxidoreductase [Nanoarchaeota archaeon]MBU1005761.1 SDR family oxidoreductase [Nanoarchaeota archaeon]MBU1946632.1 SDR family oxidoreductase [Nanoarchaeota archaeon]
MNIIVTGGAGFIGSHLCDELIERGNQVICIDNFSSGDKKNVLHLLGNDNFKLVNHDITRTIEIKWPVDQIYHLASRASPVDYQKYPVETALANSVGTNNMIRLSMVKGAVMLFASSSEAYGEPKSHPQKESYWGNVNPVGIRSCYTESKRFGEALITAYHRKYGIKANIVRIFNTYGPRMRKDDGRVVSNFITSALRDEPLAVNGDGGQTRSFCYISDMVDGLIRVMGSSFTGPKNIGNPHEITILYLAKKIKQMIQSDSEITFNPMPEDDPTKRQPDISKTRRLTGWEPQVGLETGLKKTIEWFKKL